VLTVVVPTHNRAHTLQRALDSILAQALPGGETFEVIVVDDGSSDNTGDVLARYGDPRLTVLSTGAPAGQGRGASAARNTGLRAARARFTICFDSDDEMRPGCIAAFVTAFRSGPRIGLVWSPRAVYDDPEDSAAGEPTFRTAAFVNPAEQPGGGALIPTFLLWSPGACCLGIHRGLCDEIGYFDETVKTLEDLEFGMRFAQSGTWNWARIPDVQFNYHVLPKPSLARDINPAYLASVERILDRHGAFLARVPHVHGFFLYKAARTAFTLGETAKGEAYLLRTIRADPTRWRALAYGLARRAGLLKLWTLSGKAVGAQSEWRRRRRYARGEGRAQR
jgi:glycosyltransferase involved in cell wall biosynthesis